LLSEGKSQIWVANNLGVTKQRVSYWTNHPISPRKRKAKLKPTSEIGSRAIANLINKELKEENIVDKSGRNLTITKSTINNYLKKRGLKPRKIKKTKG
jgi:predicted transcriptional regulator